MLIFRNVNGHFKSYLRNIWTKSNYIIWYYFSLRKVKMDQRKLMDNANTITDMAKVKVHYINIKYILNFSTQALAFL